MYLLRVLLVLLLLGRPAVAGDGDLKEEDFLREAHVDILNTNFDRALKVYNRMLKKYPQSKLAWFGIGHLYFRQFKWASAAEGFKNAIAIDDKYADGYFYLGKTYFNWRKPKEGIAAFEKFLEVDPNSGYADRVRTWIRTLKEVGEDIDWLI